MMSKYVIPDFARKYISHGMIEAHTKLPAFPDTRARLLFCMLEDERTADRQALYTLAVSLAQLGLDTHDWVAAAKEEESFEQMRSRQLRVLAGDYFNGRFYQLLAQAGKLEAVRLVSRAICEVNRVKMIMNERLRQLKLTTDEYVEHMVAIRSELFLAFAGFLRGPNLDRFPDLLRGITRCELIHEELQRDDAGELHGGWSYCYMLQHATADERAGIPQADQAGMKALSRKYKTSGLLQSMLEEQLRSVRRLIEQFESDGMRTELFNLLEPFIPRLQKLRVADER